MADPRVIVTGASGFLGRHLLLATRDRMRIYGLARRSPAISDAPTGDAITWMQVDIANRQAVDDAFDLIRQEGGADALVHLAGHCDFTGQRHPDYQAVNVTGMRHVLDATARIGVPTVVFTSSVAACQFPPAARALTEESPPDGDTPYAESKRAGEEMLAGYGHAFRGIVIRFGALFSDWCEYEPLFHFLESWFARSTTHRDLAGCGQSAVPYLHVRDGVDLLLTVMLGPERFPHGTILLGSPDGATTHRELFEAATAAHSGQRARPLLVPRAMCRLGIGVRRLAGRISGVQPFERSWMVRMIDRRLTVDARRTREHVGWAPRARLGILRRMPFLVEHRKTYPTEWHRRNHAAMRRVSRFDNLRIHQLLEARAGSICGKTTDRLLTGPETGVFGAYHCFSRDQLCAEHRMLIEELMMAVRTAEKGIFLEACRELAARRREHGFGADDICVGLEALRDACLTALRGDPNDDHWTRALHDHVAMTFQFGVDGVHEAFEDSLLPAGS